MWLQGKHIEQGNSALHNMPEQMLQPSLHGLQPSTLPNSCNGLPVSAGAERLLSSGPSSRRPDCRPSQAPDVPVHGRPGEHGVPSTDASSPASTARLLDSAELAGAGGRSYPKFI